MYSLIGKTATFRQLKALDMIARLGSVSRAAEELNLTQPAVSLQVRLLEEAVGAALLQRVGRGVQLTAAGEIVSRYAREILHLWSEAGDEVAALTGDLGGTLRIGAITTAEYLIPPLLVKFTATRPHVKTYFKVGNRDDIIRMLATHEIDLAVMGSAPKELRTHAVEFAKHPMVFVAAPGHPLMQRKRVALKDLESAHLLVRERGAGTRSTVETCSRTRVTGSMWAPNCRATRRSSRWPKRGSAWRSCRCTRVHSSCAPGCSGNCRSPATRSSANGMWSRSPTGAFRRSRGCSAIS